MHAVIGLGSSDVHALDRVRAGVAALAAHPSLRLLSSSRAVQSPAWGGATVARFVNAAVVVETALAPPALVAALHAVEAAHGRVRAEKNASRALDLDVLLLLEQVAPSTEPTIPHPRLFERAFAVVPAVEALSRARLAIPFALAHAARALGRAPLLPLGEAHIGAA